MLVDISNLNLEIVSQTDSKGVFAMYPLPQGFGHTLGNSLRRILLTSIEGAAATQVKLSGADHQFTTIPGVKEDTVQICLNLKQLRFACHSTNPVVVTIDRKGPGVVSGKDIEGSSEIEVLNKDLHIATLSDKNTHFKAEITIERGVGYSPSEDRQSSKIGVIVLDSVFSPVKSATYAIEPTRFGKNVDLDKLTLTVETDGSIEPIEAVKKSAEIVESYFKKVLLWETAVKQTSEQEKATAEETPKKSKSSNESIAIDDLPLQTRTINALKKQGVDTLDKLAALTDSELEDVKNLGEKSVTEIKKLLKKEGLR